MMAFPRSGIPAVVAIVLLVVGASVRAAEPWEAELQDYLAGYGVACEADGLAVTCGQGDLDVDSRAATYVLPGWFPDDEQAWAVTLYAVSAGFRPVHGDALSFLVGAAALLCPADSALIKAFAVPEAPDYLEGVACRFTLVGGGDVGTPQGEIRTTLLEVSPLPTLAPSLPPIATPVHTSPLPSPTAEPTLPVALPADASPPPLGRGDFDRVIPRPSEVVLNPLVMAQSAFLALLLVFLMPFPAQLFNSTLEAHEAEVRRWLRLGSGGAMATLGRFWASWLGVAIFIAIGALLYSFLDPGFGTDARSLGTFLGLLFGIVVVTAIASLPALVHGRRERVSARLKVVPLSLAIGVLCVLTSRLADFQPGYLYGVIIGLTFARELSVAEKGRATAFAAGSLLGVALVSWLALAALPRSAEADTGLTIARTTLSALIVGGLEAVAIGLLPLRFLPGESLFRSNRVVWALLLGIGGFAFFHILINPASGYLSTTSRTPLIMTIALLLGFGLVSVAFWGWFRFRDPGAPPAMGDG